MSDSVSQSKPNSIGSLRDTRALWVIVGPAVLAVLGVFLALRRQWTCDDAFISFRYAENLVQGLGLVYNAGERVEGYTNFLWTVWIALGLWLGIGAEAWAGFWGLVCYGGAIALLALLHFRIVHRIGLGGFTLPVAALLAAVHPDWNIYATGGLETTAFTFILILGYGVLVGPADSERRWIAAGVVFAIASMTRPDGVIFAALGGVFVLWTARQRVRGTLGYGLAFLAVWVPYTWWRVSYYGDFFPNTYYAKSAYLAWYSQGWTYVRLYFSQYWVLALGIPIALVTLGSRGRELERQGPDCGTTSFQMAGLAVAFALCYTFYVMRVGGGFMHARLLIPATPFCLIALEIGAAHLQKRRGKFLQPICCIVGVAGVLLTPSPLPDRADIRGIVNEWLFYRPEAIEKTRTDGERLRPFFADLPISVGFRGGRARMIYYSKVAIAIECETGLTDHHIAHQPLRVRGRVGHEKKASPEYLIDKRRVNLVFFNLTEEYSELDEVIPIGGVTLGPVGARPLHWDPRVMAELKRRGAEFDDFLEFLDGFILRMSNMTDEQVLDAYRRCKRFYFDHVDDPARETAFLTRLGF